MIDFLDDHPFLSIVGGIALFTVVFLWASDHDYKVIEQKCGVLMQSASTHRDTLDVHIACLAMHSDAETRATIAIGAGVIAGSAAGRR